MGLCAVLLICLSQAELARVWAQEQTGTLHGGGPLRSDGAPEVPRGRRERRESPNRAGVEHLGGGGLAIDTLPDNMTRVVEDSQKYYLWQSFGPEDARTQELWTDLNAIQQSQVRVHGILSNTHRQAARVALSFDFPFYGHSLRQITIATGGFIFTGEITHRMLTATQYIAPLMANFDPSFSKNSTVRYMDNGDVFVVQWDKVRIQGREADGPFTFQTALHSNGTIVFGFRDVPLGVEQINSTEHPVKVGLSDAFMALPSSSPDTKRRTIYEYHRVEIDTTKIINNSAFLFTPLPTCLKHTSCELCLNSKLTTGCGWCNTLQRCSDGIDRHRQEWLDYKCPEEAKDETCEDYTQGASDTTVVPYTPTDPEANPTPVSNPERPVTEDLQTGTPGQEEAPEHTAIIAGVVAALVLLVFLTLLAVYYINTHPTVAPPFYLMQRRTNNYWPSMKFRNQGCHSSYAEVELGHEKEGFIEAEHC
ncbi:plexin domain-containing protein 1 isoform X2 [Clupea harengus]|uniref:Plexin domain-containing protein 1 isoform X2 n=1 Tax=Clupea harengus TaxID=7950 RepID=A0A6P3W3Z7_CLUHA|nr:plexin domain-containing protein 1 isoform X2 [Clupea harengus]